MLADNLKALIVTNPELTDDELDKPIPEVPTVEGWKDINILPSEEPLVATGPFSKFPYIFTSSVYADEHSNSPYVGEYSLDSSLLTMFVRESVAIRLTHAQQLLPKGYHIVVFDAYRSLEVQGALYSQYYNKLQELYPDWSEEALSAETQKYVSIPSNDINRPSPHNTGGSVDLAIVKLNDEAQARTDVIDERLVELEGLIPSDATAEEEATNPLIQEYYLLSMERMAILKNDSQLLEFGTEFDNGTTKAALRYYEDLANTRLLTAEEEQAARNRRMLYMVMTEAGMVPYEAEWWHFNAPESQMGVKVLGNETAKFGASNISAENTDFERMRQQHRLGISIIAKDLYNGVRHRSTLDFTINELVRLNEQAVNQGMQDPKNTNLPLAAKISPQKAA